MKLGAAGVMTAALAHLTACTGARDTLARGQAYYEDNRFEQALSVWRELSRSDSDLSPSERARYAYLRGMTDYRLGFRDDARHWLAVAKSLDARHPGSVEPAWMARLDAALDDLNREIFGIRAVAGDAVQRIEAPVQRIEAPVQRIEAPVQRPAGDVPVDHPNPRVMPPRAPADGRPLPQPD